ncbi:hypothetical protein PI124_g20562 [Phytophthora idaei]|nr:hypothetical protein PI124_g20562 [Phytophthora idaei]
MEHHAFLAGERSTDADLTTAEPATVATERPAAPLAPEARLNRPQPMGKYAAYLLRNKQLLSQQRRAVAAKTLAGSGKKRLMQKKKQSTRPGDQAMRNRMTKKKMETTKNDSDCDEDEDAMPFDEVLLDVDSDDPTEMLAESEPADEDADNETTQDPNTFPPDQHNSELYDGDYGPSEDAKRVIDSPVDYRSVVGSDQCVFC